MSAVAVRQQQQHINNSSSRQHQQSDDSVVYSKTSPRPPVPGSEQGAAVFSEVKSRQNHGMGHLGDETSVERSKVGGGGRKMAPSPKATSESGASIGSTRGERGGFEPEGSADITPPFSESNSNNSTPAYLR